MFCQSCGSRFSSNEMKVCANCGILKGLGETHCSKCGNKLDKDKSSCLKCGSAFEYKVDRKSRVMAGMLGVFLGFLGFHNFYLGYKVKGYIQLAMGLSVILTALSAVWGAIEGILILLGVISNDANGNSLRK